ncbi:MAG: EAL domain-containing protein [Woeseiaceae bacterium]
MHPILKAQISDATLGDGLAKNLDVGQLLDIVSRFYEMLDGSDTSIHEALNPVTPDADVTATNAAVNHQEKDEFAVSMASSSGVRARFSGLLSDDLRAVLDNVADMVVTVSREGIVHFSNRVAVQFFAPQNRSLTGLNMIDLLGLDNSRTAEEWLTPFVVDLSSTSPDLSGGQIRGKRSGGSPFHLELTVSRLSAAAAGDFVICMRDVSARVAAASALAENEERYRALVEHAPDAILVFDIDAGQFVDANEKATQLFNLPRKRLLASGFFGHRGLSANADNQVESKRINKFIARALLGEQPTFEWLYSNSNDYEVPCEVRLSRLPAADRQLIRVNVLSIADRKRKELAEYSEKKLLEMIASDVALKSIMHALCRTAEQLVPGSRSALMLLDKTESTLQLFSAPSLSRTDIKFLKHLPVDRPALSCGVALATKKPVITTDVSAHNAWADHTSFARRLSIKSAWSMPIVKAEDHPIGTIDLYFDSKREPNTTQLDAISNLARMAAIALNRDRSKQDLLQSEGRFRGLFENVVESVYIADTGGRIIAANPAMVEMLGFDDEAELLGSVTRENTYQSSKDMQRFVREIEEHGEVRRLEAVMVRRDGTPIDVIENARAVVYPDGQCCIEGTISDISDRKRAERRIFAEKERAEVTLKSIGDGVITTDSEGHIEYLNPVAEALTGFSMRALSGEPVEELLTLVNEHSREMIDNPITQALQEGRVVTLSTSTVLIDRSGKEVPVQTSTAPIRDRLGHIVGAVMVFHDVSNMDRLLRKLSYQSAHDALTGFVNRQEFDSVLASAISRVKAGSIDSCGLLYVDLDQFKVVNDTFGHTAGDELIRQIAVCLQSAVPVSDMIARLGGDEFAILVNGADVDRVMAVAERVRSAIESHRFEWQDSVHTLGASIGVVMLDKGSSVSSILSAADVACFAAKDNGRNQIHLYREGEASDRHQEMHWLTRINRALEENRFELFFQPIVSTVTDGGEDCCTHYELLLRMIDEDGQRVLPATFIAAAERYDRMPALDRWVVQEALSHADTGNPNRQAAYTLSINLSGNSLSDDRFLEFVKDSLREVELCKGAVCFEITETAAIANLSRVTHFMNELKVLGCLFSLDDFGSGLSSFAYLKNLPVDYIKVDGTFVRNLVDDLVDQSMVTAIQQVGLAMGIETIAEHVETQDIRDTLATLGIPLVQGFGIARPSPMDEFSPWVSARKLA